MISPEKWFDYLEGKLPEAEKKELDDRLEANTVLQRELAAARELHAARQKKPDRDVREVVAPAQVNQPENTEEARRGALLSAKFGIWFIALVFVNVAVGVWFIAVRQKKQVDAPQKEAAIREQLARSIQNTAATALPPPTFEASDITIEAPQARHEEIAAKIMTAANELGGSAAKALADDRGFSVLADIPPDFIHEFQLRLVPLGGPDPGPKPPAPPAGTAAKKILQVRLQDPAAKPAAP